jgi:hypothetical protein
MYFNFLMTAFHKAETRSKQSTDINLVASGGLYFVFLLELVS